MKNIIEIKSLISDGERGKAKSELAKIVIADGNNLEAWILLKSIVDDPAKKEYCQKRINSIIESLNLSQYRIIEAVDDSLIMQFDIAYRFPEMGYAYFKLGSQIKVQEGRIAIIFRNGEALDLLEPGINKLSRTNIPLLLDSIENQIKDEDPFLAELYFVSLDEYSMKWGTPQPIIAGNINEAVALIQGFGDYIIRVDDPRELIQQIGGRRLYSLEDFGDRFRTIFMSALIQVIGDLSNREGLSVLEILASTSEIESRVTQKVKPYISDMGINLVRYSIAGLKPAKNSVAQLHEMILFGKNIDTNKISDLNKPDLEEERFIVERGEIYLGGRDQYITGQAGAVGPGSHAEQIKFSQKWEEINKDYDLQIVAEELNSLRQELKKQTDDPEKDLMLGNLASAEIAAINGDGSRVLGYLSTVGRWVLDVAKEIGVVVAAEIIKTSIGING